MPAEGLLHPNRLCTAPIALFRRWHRPLVASPARRAIAKVTMSSAEFPDREPDVLVIGAGNAALCAAISAHENGARVLMLEAAPFEERGGNSHFTGGAFRFAFAGMDDLIAVLPSRRHSMPIM